MTDTEALLKLRARIQQLRRMTVDRGCSETEARAAAAHVERLIEEYELDAALLAEEGFGQIRKPLGRSRRRREDIVWPDTGRLARCDVYLDRDIEGRLVVVFHGREAYLLIADYLFDLIAGVLARSRAAFRTSADYKRRRKPSTRAAALGHFTEGLAHGLIVAMRRATARFDAEIDRELAAAGKDLARLGTELVARKPVAGRGWDNRYNTARWSGYTIGRSTEISQGVAGGAGPKRIGHG